MKTKINLLAAVLITVAVVFSSCKKDNTNPPSNPNTLSGLGHLHGFPTGTHFSLPPYVSVIGSIRGGYVGKMQEDVNKDTYHGPFPISQEKTSDYIDYGTGTYVNLYIQFYNSLGTDVTLTIPGGLIFCDSLDVIDSLGIYQKGYILQSVDIALPALDTAMACIKAYCLNHTLMPSSYNSVYYIGPITNNPDLNQISTIMATKQYPYGNEYNIQSIIWNVTDYGLNLDSSEVSYLNSLP